MLAAVQNSPPDQETRETPTMPGQKRGDNGQTGPFTHYRACNAKTGLIYRKVDAGYTGPRPDSGKAAAWTQA